METGGEYKGGGGSEPRLCFAGCGQDPGEGKFCGSCGAPQQ